MSKFFQIFKLYNYAGLPGKLLLLRPIIYLIFSRKRDLSQYSAVDASAMIFILYSAVCFVVACKYLFDKSSSFGKDILFKSAFILFILYSILAFASMFWSVNVSLTGFRAFECLAMVLIITATIQNLFKKEDMSLTIKWSLLYAIIDILTSILKVLQRTSDLNFLLESSQMFATTFFFMALLYTPRKWYNYLIIIMSIFSMSTVAYIGMAIGSVCVFWKDNRMRFIGMICAASIGIAILYMGTHDFLKQTIFFDKEGIGLEYSSGRNLLMAITLETLNYYPLGLGFFSAEPYIFYQTFSGAISAHNSLFSAALGMGYPGLIILSLFFLTIGYTVFTKYIDKRYKGILIGCFCVAFLQCMGNPAFGTRVYGAWMPTAYIFILIAAFYVKGKYYKHKSIK